MSILSWLPEKSEKSAWIRNYPSPDALPRIPSMTLRVSAIACGRVPEWRSGSASCITGQEPVSAYPGRYGVCKNRQTRVPYKRPLPFPYKCFSKKKDAVMETAATYCVMGCWTYPVRSGADALRIPFMTKQSGFSVDPRGKSGYLFPHRLRLFQYDNRQNNQDAVMKTAAMRRLRGRTFPSSLTWLYCSTDHRRCH